MGKPGISVDYCGTVQWFRDNLGYGFIECPDFSHGIFVHYSRLMTDEPFKTLAKGQIVVFQVVETLKPSGLKLMAVNVREKRIEKVKAQIVSTI